MLVHEGLQPVFVIEDTEAVVGGGAGDTVVDGFFDGPLRAFVQELAAPCLVAVQTHLTVDRPAFERLAAVMEVIEIPHLRGEARDALPRILARRLEVGGAAFALAEALADDALDGLVQFYDDAAGRPAAHARGGAGRGRGRGRDGRRAHPRRARARRRRELALKRSARDVGDGVVAVLEQVEATRQAGDLEDQPGVGAGVEHDRHPPVVAEPRPRVETVPPARPSP